MLSSLSKSPAEAKWNRLFATGLVPVGLRLETNTAPSLNLFPACLGETGKGVEVAWNLYENYFLICSWRSTITCRGDCLIF